MATTWRVKTEAELLASNWIVVNGPCSGFKYVGPTNRKDPVPFMARPMLEDGKRLCDSTIAQIVKSPSCMTSGAWVWSQEMFTPILAAITPKEARPVMEKCKGIVNEFLAEHGNTLIMIAIVILLDHYLFDGALRERLKKSAESLLDKLPGGHHPTIEAK